jgi:hypothetical protein
MIRLGLIVALILAGCDSLNPVTASFSDDGVLEYTIVSFDYMTYARHVCHPGMPRRVRSIPGGVVVRCEFSNAAPSLR